MNICLTMVVECTKKGLFECLWSTTSSVMNMEDWYACKKCPCELKAAAAWPWFFLFILHPVLWGGADKAFAVLWVPCPATCTLWHQHSIHKDKQCKEAISVCGADKRLNENSPLHVLQILAGASCKGLGCQVVWGERRVEVVVNVYLHVWRCVCFVHGFTDSQLLPPSLSPGWA